MNFVRPAAEEIRLVVVAVAEGVIVVEDEIQIVKEVNDDGRVRHHEKACGRAPAIDVLTPDVQRRRDHAASFPSHGLLASASRIPDETLALAVQNVEHFLKEITLRFGLSIRRKLAEIACVDAFASDQINVSSSDARAEPLPRFHFGLPQVADVVVLINRKILLLKPLLPGIDVRLIPFVALRSHRALLLRVMVVVA